VLTELRIRDFALIHSLAVRLGAGLNVLTGETGAGKSIVVDALSLLLGGRGSVEYVRAGAARASVEGVFELEGSVLRDLLEERGIEPGDDGVVVLKREVAAEGRSRAWINGSPTTVGVLAEVGGALVTLHGQHEHQTLLRRDEQRSILDAYAGLEPLAAEVADAYGAARAAAGEIETLERRRRETLQRVDFLRFQVEEIDAAAPRPGEEETLEAEACRLEHAEELLSLAGSLQETVSGGDGSTTAQLGGIRRALEQLVRIDPEQEPLRQLYDDAYYSLEELGSRLGAYVEGVERDPGRLDVLRRRQDLLFRLRGKYGPRLEDVIATAEAARAELSALETAEWELADLQAREAELGSRLEALAGRLGEGRLQAAGTLAEDVERILPELGMSGGRFEVAVLPLAATGPYGREEVEFRVSLNRGFEPRPLAQVASGGELSRVMLALKTVLARLESVPTLVFDEVDAGIGGRVALQVGEKMRRVAEDHQVLAITHLPQIASRAHRHLLVQKTERDGTTVTDVRLLEDAAREEEVARMLSGDPESVVSREHARSLLQGAG
jgi:DNA repair protein RecN (Recombination protein N)